LPPFSLSPEIRRRSVAGISATRNFWDSATISSSEVWYCGGVCRAAPVVAGFACAAVDPGVVSLLPHWLFASLLSASTRSRLAR